MKKIKSKKSFFFVISVSILAFIFWVIKAGKEDYYNRINAIKEIDACKKDYLSYSFQGKLVKITREGKIDWMYIKGKSKINDDKKCYFYIKKVNDSIVKITFDGMFTFPHYHFPLTTGGYVYKRKGSSAIFYKWKGKTYLLSDFYCPDFDIDWYYSDEKYSYKCDSTLHKVTKEWYWYVVRDSISN